MRRNRDGTPATWAAAALLLLIAGLLPVAADAPESRVLDDKWFVSLGLFAADFRTSAQVGIAGVLGGVIRLEDDLGIDDGDSFVRLESFYRFNSKQSLHVNAWSLARVGTSIIDERIEFEDVVFEVGALVAGSIDTDLVSLTYRHTLLRTARGEAGFSAGLGAYAFDVATAGEAKVDDGMGGTKTEFVEESAVVVVPVPTVGFFLNYNITPSFVFRTRAEVLDVSIQDYEAFVLEYQATFDYFFTRHVGLGAGVDVLNIDFRDMGDTPFVINYRQSGLVAYLTLVF